jgi:hypothetical protein
LSSRDDPAEIGTTEQEDIAVTAEATCRHFRLTLDGTIELEGKRPRTTSGTAILNVNVRLPCGPPHARASGIVADGRWHISRALPAANLDPVPPSYRIVIRYCGDTTVSPATAERRVRIESERAGLCCGHAQVRVPVMDAAILSRVGGGLMYRESPDVDLAAVHPGRRDRAGV